MKSKQLPLLIGLLALPALTLADRLPGEAKALYCTSCHGQQGMKSAPGQPAIGGRPAQELVAVLHDYQRLRRFNPAMQMLLLSMSEQDVVDVAEYFSQAGGAARLK